MSSMSARFLQPRFATPTAAVKESCDGPEVVREACGGDRAAFGQLYSRYAPMVHGVLLARVPYAEAEDLVHEVFVAAFRQIGKLRSPEAFPGWLAAIARNSAVEFTGRSAIVRKRIWKRPSAPHRSPRTTRSTCWRSFGSSRTRIAKRWCCAW